MSEDDDQSPLVEPRERVVIPNPRDDPRALATAEVEDPDDLDQEDHRRMENLRRRVLQRPGRRRRYLEAIAELDPGLHDELVELRRLSPQAFRKRLQHEVRRLGLHRYLWHGPRGTPRHERESAPERSGAESEDPAGKGGPR